MKIEEFVRNNRGIDDGQDPPKQLLETIYTNILEDEIIMKEADMWESDVVTFIAPHKAGWLLKKTTNKVSTWKRNWFVLADSCLYYFTNPTDENPRCIIPLDNVRVGRGHKALEIVLTSADDTVLKSAKNMEDGSMEIGDRKDFTLKASNPEEREAWVKVLQTFMDRSPVHKAMRDKQEAPAAGEKIELPPPVAEGWMRKRGENNTGWKQRYFCLFHINSSSDSNSKKHTMLYYYASKEMAQRMIDLGDEVSESGDRNCKNSLLFLPFLSFHIDVQMACFGPPLNKTLAQQRCALDN